MIRKSGVVTIGMAVSSEDSKLPKCNRSPEGTQPGFAPNTSQRKPSQRIGSVKRLGTGQTVKPQTQKTKKFPVLQKEKNISHGGYLIYLVSPLQLGCLGPQGFSPDGSPKIPRTRRWYSRSNPRRPSHLPAMGRAMMDRYNWFLNGIKLLLPGSSNMAIWEIPINGFFNGKTSINGRFSTAMFDCRRVRQ